MKCFGINKNNRFTPFKMPYLEKLTHNNVHAEEEDTGGWNSSVVVLGLAVHSVAGSILLRMRV